MNEITANELEGYVAEKRLESVVCHFGPGYARAIDYVVGTGEWIVLDHRHVVYTGTDPSAALDAYYDIPRRD